MGRVSADVKTADRCIIHRPFGGHIMLSE